MEELAKRMVALDQEAYREFADIFGPRFRSFFLKRGLTASDAEDLAVSCITDIALKIEKYKSEKKGSFVAWIYTIIRHELVNWWRKKPDEVPLTNDGLLNIAQEDDPRQNIDIICAVENAVAKLSDTDQTIIQLRDLGAQHSYAEIAELLDIKPGNVRVRHHRALQRLQSILEEDPHIRKLLNRKENNDRRESK